MFMANLNEDGIKAFEALTRAMKTYSDISMKHYNDLPTERKDLTSEGKSIEVNFITEPVDEALVNARLQAMGLSDYVDEQTE
ncbi:hypothetical protein C8B47_10730 [filamentous cyanobacterium CCP4]|nr:hypothetical protein C8B47_10730 [filamentous cyanobacterium CCP4]